MKYIIILISLMLIGCGDDIDNYQACDIEPLDYGLQINCGGETHIIYDGQDGADSIVSVYDPCGNGPGVDEIVLKLNNGQYFAWYLNLGLFLLEEGVIYRTTDIQKCKFKIQSGFIMETI